MYCLLGIYSKLAAMYNARNLQQTPDWSVDGAASCRPIRLDKIQLDLENGDQDNMKTELVTIDTKNNSVYVITILK